MNNQSGFIDLGRAPKIQQMEGLETTILTGLHGEKMMMVLSTTLPKMPKQSIAEPSNHNNHSTLNIHPNLIVLYTDNAPQSFSKHFLFFVFPSITAKSPSYLEPNRNSMQKPIEGLSAQALPELYKAPLNKGAIVLCEHKRSALVSIQEKTEYAFGRNEKRNRILSH